MKIDIPLSEAVICWTSESADQEATFQIRRLGEPYNDHGPHENTAGAVYTAWKQASTEEQVRMLFGEVMSIMARDGVPFVLIHAELLKVPEYRDTVLAEDVLGPESAW